MSNTELLDRLASEAQASLHTAPSAVRCVECWNEIAPGAPAHICAACGEYVDPGCAILDLDTGEVLCDHHGRRRRLYLSGVAGGK